MKLQKHDVQPNGLLVLTSARLNRTLAINAPIDRIDRKINYLLMIKYIWARQKLL